MSTKRSPAVLGPTSLAGVPGHAEVAVTLARVAALRASRSTFLNVGDAERARGQGKRQRRAARAPPYTPRKTRFASGNERSNGWARARV